MLLSAALIVRNEAAFLDTCLASLDGLVDEIVVVDTGSTDDSVAIAHRHGARVAHQAWTQDFASARNCSLDLASGDWILYIDADERVRPGDHSLAREWLEHAGDCVAGLVRFVPRVDWTPYREYRLWRNRPDLRFRGAMHESIVSAVTRAAKQDGLRIAPFDLVTIEHFGYEGDQSVKFARDEPMLLAEIEQLPERAYLYDHLARIYEAQGDSKRAVATWRQGIAVARARNSMRREDLLVYVNLIIHLLTADLVDGEVAGLLDEALAAFPRTPTLELAAARHELATGRAAVAAERVEWLVSFDPDDLIDDNSYDRRVFGEWAWELLGRCRFALGDDAGAADAFAHAEHAAPDTDAYRVQRRLADARARRPPTSGSGS